MKQGKRAKEEENKLKPKILWIELSVLIVVIVVAFSVYLITNTEEYANQKMTKIVTRYYEKEIKENAVGVNRLIITLQTLKDAGYRIGGIKGKPGVSDDLSKAYAYIIIENPEEIDPEKIIYTIENHLNGE